MLAFSFPVITVYKVGIKLPNPFSRAELLFVSYHVLKFLLRNFQGCCLLFNYQGSMLFVVSLATAILDYHNFNRLSTTFSNFFHFLFKLLFHCFSRKFYRIPATVVYTIIFYFKSQPLF